MATIEIRTCAFTGHREIPAAHIAPLIMNLDAAITAFYGMGCRAFYAGGARGFDTLAAERVLAFREKHPDVALYLILPCRDQMRGWREEDAGRARAVIAAANGYRYLQNEYSTAAMHIRNRALIDAAEGCIAYVTRPESGGGQTLRLAEKKGIPTVNLALRIEEQ